ncbi:uncharacterized protein LOC133638459 isoform X5 [Entelurus aequoreus]|uniref:uncharacterized protein LOC133638459 isoform X5 n=1 Tax=Entelurus aequoreus TaxID=161455 RepID=UPI002B1DFC2C|nr:uncharacterized protein LOC133638459 isoform X5 [Entelurus aequoreus]
MATPRRSFQLLSSPPRGASLPVTPLGSPLAPSYDAVPLTRGAGADSVADGEASPDPTSPSTAAASPSLAHSSGSSSKASSPTSTEGSGASAASTPDSCSGNTGSGSSFLGCPNGAFRELFEACRNGDVSRVKKLVDTANVNAKDMAGRKSTPLHFAAGFGRKDVVDHLLQNGANIHARDDGGLIPLHNACSFGHSEVVSLLLCQGAEPNARDNWNYTPLHEAAIKGKIDVCIEEEAVSSSAMLPQLQQPATPAGTKLPEFWRSDPASWFQHIEALFHLRGIGGDDSRYYLVVTALDQATTRRTKQLLRTPPQRGKYAALKNLLLRRFTLTDAERADRLLSLPGLGDSTALDLMDSMLSLLGSEEGGFIFPHLFLRQLPPAARAVLANSASLASGDYRGLAEEADRVLLASRRFAVQSVEAPPPADDGERGPSSGGGSRYPEKARSEPVLLPSTFWRQSSTVCPSMLLHGPGKLQRQRSVAAVGAGEAGELLFIADSSSRRRFLVDSGSQVSLLPATDVDRATGGCGPLLNVANGSSIDTFGSRLVTVCFHGRKFQWDFIIAAITVPIIGADFLCANGLLVDVANRRLIDAVSFSTFTCKAGGLGPLTHANYLVSGDVFQRLLADFPSLITPAFSTADTKHGVEHFIPTVGPPVFARAHRLDAAKSTIAKEEFATMERLGIVRRSNSPWASPLHMVPKSDGSWRPCGDFRRLNNITTHDRYPIPHIQDSSARLAGAAIFSKVDLVRGYHQVPVRAEDVPKTAVVTPFGLFEFLHMSFGLKGAAQTFQRLMDSVLCGLNFVFVYLDDILVASPSAEQHQSHLTQVFTRLDEHGLIVNPSKCQFGLSEIDFLGHRISSLGAIPLPSKVQVVADFPRPSTVKALQEFLGMINFYNRFLPRAAHLLQPLYGALRNKKASDSLEWSPQRVQAFHRAKSELAEAALLAHPVSAAPVALTTDASDVAVGAVVEQRVANVWQPLAFFSRKLRDNERKYSVFDRELLALYLATRHFRFLLEGRSFTAFVDHKPLTFAMSKVTEPWSARQQRHLSAIS